MEKVRIVMVHALPLPGTDAFEEHGGAFINIYTTEQSEDEALAIAAREVTEAGWQIQSIEDNHLVVREDFLESPEGLEYFEQALIDDIVVVIHMYSATPDEDDTIH